MKAPLYFSAKSIGQSRRGARKPQSLHTATRHNMRELQAEMGSHEGISPELSHLNVNLHGASSPKEIVAYAENLKRKYSVPKRKQRKDHVQALEFIISVRQDSDVDLMAYFNASVRWLIGVFGEEMLLSAVVHFDEGAPHMHALVLPIIDHQYQGGAPINKTNLPKLTKNFADNVGKPFGFSFERKRKMHGALRDVAFNLVVDRLTEQSDPVLGSQVWSVVVESIHREPVKYVEKLGLNLPEMPPVKKKTLTQTMIGTGRRTSEDRVRRSDPTPILCRTTHSGSPFFIQEAQP